MQLYLLGYLFQSDSSVLNIFSLELELPPLVYGPHHLFFLHQIYQKMREYYKFDFLICFYLDNNLCICTVLFKIHVF